MKSPTANSHVSSRAATWLADRPIVGLTLLGALLTLSLIGLTNGAPVDSFQEGEDWELADRTWSEFELGSTAGVIAIFGDVLEPGAESGLRKLEDRIEAFEWVEQLITPWDIPGARSRTLVDLAEHPLAKGTFIVAQGSGATEGRRGKGLVLPIQFAGFTRGSTAGELWPGSEWPEALEMASIESLGANADGLEVGVTGEGPVSDAQDRAFTSERWRFMGIGALLGLIIASAAFRSLQATLLAGLPPLLGVVISTGVARLVGLGSEGFASIVLPLLVLTIGFTDSLHIVVAAVRARTAGASGGPAAVRIAVAELSWPCALTSLTTAIGFASLATAGNALIVDFGLSCALATGVTLVCVLVMIPLLARTPLGRNLERVRPPSFEGDPLSLGPIARVIESVMGIGLRAPRVTATLATVLTIGVVVIAMSIEADRRAMSDLAEGSDAAATLRRVDSELGGVFPINVRVDWENGVPLDDALQASAEAAAVLNGERLISGAHGPAEIVGAIPFGAAGLMVLPDLWSAQWIDFDARRGLVHARVPDAGAAALIPAFARVRARLALIERPGLRVRLVGSRVAYLEAVTEVTAGLRRSLGLAAVLILITLAAAFRSWRLGLASVVPNLLPIGAAAAGLGWMGGYVDVSTLTALTLSLGIATDDTIHVLARWRGERERGAPPVDAARAAVLRTLPALTLTTLTLAAAFGQLLTSSLPTIRDFGMLAGTTLIVAFFADVWLLPALLVALTRRGRSG